MPGPLVLCYHAVSERWPAALSLTPTRLEAQLRWLARRGYRGVRFSDAVAEPGAGQLVVSFDDAFMSVFELALPILDELGFPGTLFVPTDYIGTGQPLAWAGTEEWLQSKHSEELTPMGWREIELLAGRGWEIGSHTRSHPRLPDISDEEIEGELIGSRSEIERRLGGRCRSLAYPYGAHDARVVSAVARSGYEAAAALSAGLAETEPLRWPRVGLYHSDSFWTFQLKASPLTRRLRATRLAGPAHALRQTLRRR